MVSYIVTQKKQIKHSKHVEVHTCMHTHLGLAAFDQLCSIKAHRPALPRTTDGHLQVLLYSSHSSTCPSICPHAHIWCFACFLLVLSVEYGKTSENVRMTLGLRGIFSGVGLVSRFSLTRHCESVRQGTVSNCLLWGIADMGPGSPSPCLLTRERSQLPIVLPFISAILAGHRASSH